MPTPDHITARAAATATVLEVCDQTLDPTDTNHAEKLVYLITDMMCLADAIAEVAEHGTVIVFKDDINRMTAQRSETIVRMAGWIRDIGARAVKDFDSQDAKRHHA